MDDLERPIITPLVRALTVTPTLFGVPYLYFMFIGVATAVIFLATKNLLSLDAVGRIAVAKDAHIFEILAVKTRKCPPRSKALWGIKSYRV